LNRSAGHNGKQVKKPAFDHGEFGKKTGSAGVTEPDNAEALITGISGRRTATTE
jgi:hypothetical protein